MVFMAGHQQRCAVRSGGRCAAACADSSGASSIRSGAGG